MNFEKSLALVIKPLFRGLSIHRTFRRNVFSSLFFAVSNARGNGDSSRLVRIVCILMRLYFQWRKISLTVLLILRDNFVEWNRNENQRDSSNIFPKFKNPLATEKYDSVENYPQSIDSTLACEIYFSTAELAISIWNFNVFLERYDRICLTLK